MPESFKAFDMWKEALEKNEMCEEFDKQSKLPTTVKIVEFSVIPEISNFAVRLKVTKGW